MGRVLFAIGGLVLLGWAVSSLADWNACQAALGPRTGCWTELGLPAGLGAGGILAIFWAAVHKTA